MASRLRLEGTSDRTTSTVEGCGEAEAVEDGCSGLASSLKTRKRDLSFCGEYETLTELTFRVGQGDYPGEGIIPKIPGREGQILAVPKRGLSRKRGFC